MRPEQQHPAPALADATPPADATRPRIVIVGGGFAGLETAKALARTAADVTLIDRSNHHCFQPLLYQVATATLSPADVAWPIRNILGPQGNTTVLMADVTAIEPEHRRILAGGVAVPYDFLVLATGATHSYFGHDEWAAIAPGLKRVEDAIYLRRRILEAFEKAELTVEADERARLLTFVVVGGGPTGVEMAGSIADLAYQSLSLDFRRFDPREARIVLVEAGPRLLQHLPEHLSQYTKRQLERMGITVRVDTRVEACDAAGVTVGGGRIEAGTIVWAAGIVASPAARWLGVEADRAGRAKVMPDLSVPGHPDIFVIGDTAAVAGPDGKPVPGIAPAAKQMGRYVGRLIARRVDGRDPPAPFRYRHQGDLAAIGGRTAVVKLPRLELRGYPGWLFWCLAHIYFLIGARNRLAVAFALAWSALTRQRSARLITDEIGGARSSPVARSA